MQILANHSQSAMGRVRNLYTAKEKLCIISYAWACGNCAAGFLLQKVQVRDWHRPRCYLNKRKQNVGSQLNSLNFHRILLIGQHKLDSWELLYQQQNYDSSSQRSTYHWLQRLWKLDIWLPMQTPMVHMQSQWLPEDYEDKLLEFQCFTIK